MLKRVSQDSQTQQRPLPYVRAAEAPVQGQCPPLLHALEAMAGNTPMLAIDLRWRGEERRIYAKAEMYNLSGSIKDRMALSILRAAYARGALRPGDTIVEATSGNAGIAFAALGCALGHPVRIYMPDWMSSERQSLLRSYGAELCLVSKADGGFLGSIAQAEALAQQRDDVFLPRQFSNNDNCAAHYRTPGPEIHHQLASIGKTPDAFVAGVGTGGTVMGVGAYFRQVCPRARVHPLEPAESPTLSTGHKVGSHRIQGISDDFIPDIVKLGQLAPVLAAHDGDAILMAQKLSRQLGLAVGISSGANLIGALKAQDALGPDAVVATVFCDDNKKYLSTDLVREEPVREGYLSPDVELLGYAVIDRLARPAA